MEYWINYSLPQPDSILRERETSLCVRVPHTLVGQVLFLSGQDRIGQDLPQRDLFRKGRGDVGPVEQHLYLSEMVTNKVQMLIRPQTQF